MSAATTIDQTLKAHRLPFGDEIACHRTIALLLEAAGFTVEREVQLSGARGRIDFYMPAERIGIEVKVKGSPTEIVRQLSRYAQAPEIHTLMLVTGRARLGQLLPAELHGKPLHVVATWRGGL